MLLLDGMGHIPALIAAGMAGLHPLTRHPSEFNTPVCTPADFIYDRMGDEGDPHFCFWTPTSDSLYNAKSLRIFIPEDLELPPAAESRLRGFLLQMRPMCVNLRLERVNTRELLLELFDPHEAP